MKRILNNSKESVYTYFVFTGSLLHSKQWIIAIRTSIN